MGKLTDTAIRNAQAGERDAQISDGGGLVLRVGRGSGDKSFWYRYKLGNSSKWIRLGTYPALSLKDARTLAAALDLKRKQGIDPIEERDQNAKRERDERDAEQKEAAAQAARLTVRDLCDRWARLELSARKDGGAEVRRSFEKDVFPTLGNVAAEDVTRPMVAALLDTVVERGARIVARNLLGDLRQMFGFAIKRGFVENDPTSHLKRDDFGRKVERARVLSDSEIRDLTRLLPDAEMYEASVSAVWVMLSTCCRVGEVTSARLEHIDLEAGAWKIPAENSKNAKAHTIYLSAFAAKHIKTLIERAERLGSAWLMPAKYASGPVCPKSLAKQIGDRQRPGLKPMKGRTPLTESLVLVGGKWTPHDLRRTGATTMGVLGVRPDVIEKCLNHVEQNRLVRIYQRQELREEQREAWRLLGDRLELLTRDDAANVVPLVRVAA
ncbi:MAG: tyrosine-type recombinase/integrase [Azoarcus sp. PHD]|nr:MAG: tyrosine-type recombinase/integrase [Azoarcus sp. PHD]